MTVRELLAAYCRHFNAAGTHGPKTRAKRDFIFNLFAAAHGDAQAAEFQPALLAKFVRSKRRWKSSATKGDVSDTIKGVWGWALRAGKIDASPFHKARPVAAAPDPGDLPLGELTRQPQTVADVIGIYLLHFGAGRNRFAAENTRRNLADFVAGHGALPLKDARRHHLVLWVQRHSRWVSQWTKRRGLGDVKAAFGWSLKMGIIDVNPFAGATMPRPAPGDRRRPMEPEQFQMLLRGTTAIFRRVLIFLKYTGCRPGEAAAARWDQLDVDRACITLEHHKTAHSNGGVPRRVMLHPIVLKLLAWVRRNRFSPGHIFVNRWGRPWSKDSLCNRVADLREACGIAPNVRLYCLRHGFVTQAILRGIDLPTVAEMAGHRRIDTTMIYCHVAGKTDHLQAALKNVFRAATQRERTNSVKSFSKIIRDYLLADPDMPDAVRDFIRAESDPENRVLKFAVVLSENFATAFGRPHDRDGPDETLVKRLIEFASEHVVWSRIAKYLLDHFATPARIALPAGCSNRLTVALTGWHGPVN